MPKTEPQSPPRDHRADAPPTARTELVGSRGWATLFRAIPGPLIGLVVIFIVMSFLSPYFLTSRNLINIISQVSDIGVMAVGEAMVILIGGIDLSVGSTLAVSMMTMAWLFKIQGWPFATALIVGLLIGALVGLLNGLLVDLRPHPALRRHARDDVRLRGPRAVHHRRQPGHASSPTGS